ncbi:MAG: hypothetical protein VXZ55_00155, partial [Planctomycetota bacterium]|nr:hypothetical protein [Planctomycetota bacterium]
MLSETPIQWCNSPLWTYAVARWWIGVERRHDQGSQPEHCSYPNPPWLDRLRSAREDDSASSSISGARADFPFTDLRDALSKIEILAPEAHGEVGLPEELCPAAKERSILVEIENELDQREGLLKQQWQARGPGICRWLSQFPLLNDGNDTSPAKIATTLPIFGGAAWPIPNRTGTVVEAVLFDPVPPLPEVLRIAQSLIRSRLESRWNQKDSSLAPTVASTLALAAGMHVELATFDSSTLEQAIQCWACPGEAIGATT